MTNSQAPQPAPRHTSGQWAYDGGVAIRAGEKLIALVYSTDVDELGLSNLTDNARLIAAAPELLEALNMALEIGDQCSRGFLAAFQEKARAAIAKATGAQA